MACPHLDLPGTVGRLLAQPGFGTGAPPEPKATGSSPVSCAYSEGLRSRISPAEPLSTVLSTFAGASVEQSLTAGSSASSVHVSVDPRVVLGSACRRIRCVSIRSTPATLSNVAVERQVTSSPRDAPSWRPSRTVARQKRSPRRERRGLTTRGRASCYGSPISLAFSWLRMVTASLGSSRPSSSCSWSARVTAVMYPAFDP